MSEQFLSQRQLQKQSQVLAPQMRQSLKMLQVPVMELQALVAQEIQANPLLEEASSIEMEQVEIEPNVNEDAPEPEAELDLENYERLSKLDDQFKDYFNQEYTKGSFSEAAEAKRQHFMDSLTSPISLQEHLLDQLNLLSLSEEDHALAEMLIGCVDEDGLISTKLDDLTIGETDPGDLERILGMIQDFEPAGVASRDLRECLLLQLRRDGEEDSIAYRIIQNHLQALGTRKLDEIASSMGIGLEAVKDAATRIGGLEPKPGREFISESTTYVAPEIFVTRDDDEWIIQLSNEYVPSLRINRHYRRLMEDPLTPKSTKRYIVDKIRAGEFLIRSIQQRQDTIMAISREIVNRQEAFMLDGIKHLKPLTMAEVAKKIDKHETTVSRAISGKFIDTPQGVYDLKYFFTAGYTSDKGKEVANEVIKNAIQNMVDSESKRKPLSDEAIRKKLAADHGIKVARRTVAKYRDEMRILASHIRKEF